MSNPSIIHRANANSQLYNTIKARNSKQNFLDYNVAGEKNICPVARSRVIVNPQTSMNATAAQQIKFQLPNHGILEDLYLITKFSKAGNNSDSSNEVALVEHAGFFAFDRVRFVYQGNTIWECDPYWAFLSQYTRATKEKSIMLDAMSGGGILGSVGAVGALTGRRAVASFAGGQSLAVPLKAFFADSLSRGFDLYSLSSPVFVEVDFKNNSTLHEVLDAGITACQYSDCELVAYLTELAPEELTAYQARNYVPSSVSSQLGFTTTHFSETISSPVEITGASSVGNVVKINSISGLVRRMYVFATKDSDVSSATARKYNNFIDIARIKLRANNNVLFELENCGTNCDKADLSTANGYKVDNMIEMYKNNLPMSAGHLMTIDTDVNDGSGTATPAPSVVNDPLLSNVLCGVGGGTCDLAKVKVINFAYNPDDYSSADGSLSVSQLSVPELEVMFPTDTTGAHTLHCVAELLTINTYNTSPSGVISFKMITE